MMTVGELIVRLQKHKALTPVHLVVMDGDMPGIRMEGPLDGFVIKNGTVKLVAGGDVSG